MKKPRIYFDMDGVLARYERHAYKGPNPLYLDNTKHYYKSVPQDARMSIVFEQMLEEKKVDIFVLSSLSKIGSHFIHQKHDKSDWLTENHPTFDLGNFIPVMAEKRTIAEYLTGRPLTVTDILIDDYNKNLNAWKEAGGTAIKYINGENSVESFDGHIIDTAMSTDDICEMLITLISY